MLKTIPQSIKRLHELFKSQDKSLFVVGGSVRDHLMKQSPKDFDLATEATPDEVIEILEKEGFRFNLQGKAFGVVVVYTEDGDFEIATFRIDQYESIEGFKQYLIENDFNKYNEFILKMK